VGKAILYGLVQGITEFLPVEQLGHLTLLGKNIPKRRKPPCSRLQPCSMSEP
jgi:undecaprenyl pyrophosphate phosphatase UppP